MRLAVQSSCEQSQSIESFRVNEFSSQSKICPGAVWT